MIGPSKNIQGLRAREGATPIGVLDGKVWAASLYPFAVFTVSRAGASPFRYLHPPNADPIYDEFRPVAAEHYIWMFAARYEVKQQWAYRYDPRSDHFDAVRVPGETPCNASEPLPVVAGGSLWGWGSTCHRGDIWKVTFPK